VSASALSISAKNESRDWSSLWNVRIASEKLVICATRRGSKSTDNSLVVTNYMCTFDTSLRSRLSQIWFSIIDGSHPCVARDPTGEPRLLGASRRAIRRQPPRLPRILENNPLLSIA
jgi:hypothetical protein